MNGPAGRLVFGYVLILVTALCWAGAWITARLAAHDAPPATVTVGRFVVASLALLPAWWALDRRKGLRLAAGDWARLAGMSLTGIITYNILFLKGIALAPASDGVVVTPGLVGPFTILLTWLLHRQRPGPRVIAGTLLSLAGVALVGWSSLQFAATDPGRVTGNLIFAISALSWAVYTVLGRRLADRIPAVTGVLLCSALGAALLAPIAWSWDGVPDPAGWTSAAWINVIYLGLFGTGVGFVTYYLAVRTVGVGRAMPAMGLVPFFGVLGAALFLGETLTPLHATGGALVIAGILAPARTG